MRRVVNWRFSALWASFDRPVTADCLITLLKPQAIAGLTKPLVGLPEEDWNSSLNALETAKLITVHRDKAGGLISVEAHPLLREYFATRLKKKNLLGWQAAHRRLYEHLCTTTKEGEEPSLEALQPLYQAVAHGCQAGLQQEVYEKVYFKRIQCKAEAYRVQKLGAFGSDLVAIACFFETPWSEYRPRLRK